MHQARRVLVVAGSAMALCVGCASTGIQHQRVQRVKTAAIVGVGAGLNIENRTQGTGAATIGAAQEMGSLGSDEKIAERKVQGNKIYDTLVAEISKSLGWSMKSREEVVNNAVNKALYDQKRRSVSRTSSSLAVCESTLPASCGRNGSAVWSHKNESSFSKLSGLIP